MLIIIELQNVREKKKGMVEIVMFSESEDIYIYFYWKISRKVNQKVIKDRRFKIFY